MEDEAPVIYGLEFQARSLCAQEAETDNIRFLVGTQSLRAENQVHYIDFDDENNVINKTIFLHREGEIWNISSSTFDAGLFSTCFNKTSDTKSELKAAVWQIPSNADPFNPASDDSSNSHPHLQLKCYLSPDEHSDVKSVLWQPAGDSHSVIGLCEDKIVCWDLDVASSTAKMTSSTSIEGRCQHKLTSGRWNPHHNCNQIATANETSIRGWDLRTMSQVYHIESAHGQLVRDLDFNPNKQYYLVSCGDDCRVKFWDTRKVSEPLKILSEHSHWAWSVRYNHFHDQLVLTSSSDSRVILNSVVSLSSEPYGHLVEKDDEADTDSLHEGHEDPPKDGVIATYEEHEDSVYAVDWSSADPWTFASLSYDGRLVINRVPRSEKYKILL
ncbi:EARP-interacting protein homolog [Physella acuta]|uniref:EARP-interacting protein homolog n=1 Tax=Physella acuta TaxID=109671 RepID=UPI0027DC2D54|nr:EARP-interacting protein homolog [Physella acuta]